VVVDRLVFPEDLRQQLIAHALEGAPDEVCGMLAGRDGRIERVFRVRNVADEVTPDQHMFVDRVTHEPTAGRRPVHYYMDPLDQLRVYREIDDLELDVLAYYHSHTHTEARPSPTDVRLARDPTALWVLVSLEHRDNPDVRAWRVEKTDPMDETGQVTEVSLA
jgi:proteasome lid subunit RPN8/RPN11